MTLTSHVSHYERTPHLYKLNCRCLTGNNLSFKGDWIMFIKRNLLCYARVDWCLFYQWPTPFEYKTASWLWCFHIRSWFHCAVCLSHESGLYLACQISSALCDMVAYLKTYRTKSFNNHGVMEPQLMPQFLDTMQCIDLIRGPNICIFCTFPECQNLILLN